MLSEKRIVFKNTLLLSVAPVLSLIIGIGFTGYLARHLGVESYGNLYYSISFVSMLAFTANFGVNTVIQREVAVKDADVNLLFQHGLFIKLLLSVVTAIAIIVTSLVTNVSGVLLKLNFILILYVIFDSVRLSFTSVFKGTMNVKPISYMDLTTQIIEIIVIIVLLAIGGKEIAIAFGKIFVILISIGGLCYYYVNKYKVKIIKIDSKRVTWFLYSGVFITIVTIVSPFYQSIGVVILGNISGIKAVGIYQASMGLIEKLLMLTMTLNDAVFPVFAGSLFRLGDSNSAIDFYFYLKIILILALGAFIGTYFVGPMLVGIFFGEEYFDAKNIIRILSVVVGLRFLNSFGGMILVARKKEIIVGIIVAFQLIVHVLFCYYLIPMYGVAGLAYAFIIAETIGLCICYCFIYIIEKLYYKIFIYLINRVICVLIFVVFIIYFSNKTNFEPKYNFVINIIYFIISICSIIFFKVVTLSEILELPNKIYGKNLYNSIKNKFINY